jgi:hypothetical protein
MGGKSMTKDTGTSKLPGAWLLQFAEKYFEQSGLDKIALPIIADIQREYSGEPHKFLTQLFFRMRGYISFWKAITLYSLFSDEGNVRIFKAIGFYRFLGIAVGTLVSLLSWKGNQVPGRVSLIPDAATGLALLCFLCLAIWFCARQLQVHYFSDIWRVSGKIVEPIGIILFIASLLLMRKLWSMPVSMLNLWNLSVSSLPVGLSFIAINYGLMLVYRLSSCFLVWCVSAVGKRMKAA